MDLHIPTDHSVKALANVVGYVTEGLDAVVVKQEASLVYEGYVHLTLAGNDRDLSIAVERASKIGGVVD
jgi:hypothetical protein